MNRLARDAPPARARPARHKPAVSNAEIAAIFEEIAAMLELDGANRYRIAAYRNAARTLQSFAPDIARLIGSGEELPKLPGIGNDLAGKIHEIVETGTCALRQRLGKELPHGLLDLMTVPGLGPKRVRRLYHDLGIESLQQLQEAATAGRIARLHGFGKKTEVRLLQRVDEKIKAEPRLPLASAAAEAETLAEYLRRVPGTAEVTIAGSYRRMRDTVGDIDLLVASTRPREAMRRFVEYPGIRDVLAQGSTRSSVVLRTGLQVDLRVVRRSEYGAALVYFTGSKAHNIAIRQRAVRRGLKISEYGVFRGGERIAGETETSVYAALDLDPILPELREDRGEVEAAGKHELPELVEPADLKGDLHAHTRATDGVNSIAEMAEAARAVGLQYLAITDHSRSLRMVHGLDASALLRQADEIDALNEQLKGFTLLKGIEVEILEEGDLDLTDEVLARLDIVVGGLHSHFDLPARRQTSRLLRAMDHPHFSILAHPHARLINERAPIEIDLPAIIRAAKQRGCALELNCQPQRMDLLDVYCRQAKEEGVLISIDSDAHRIEDLSQLRFGVGQARRGWLEKRDVLNTRALADLRKLLRR